ncbi:thymidylate synthase [Methanocalculus taiwanensis]|uniref:Putative thymidylate synthase n=1 Tax=Methanocalculus taiwanensis TaxID=106207 RepID=A0ABD4TLK1_9EURY|nr:thymidylate synthase [Methanocalculus taiwanensis]MCQ1538705.1 thymidylate synthase [Methanocalculus taiwanensis]
MKIIRAASLGRAHELIIKHILEKGRERRTENGEETLETDEIALRVENPLAEPMASSHSRFRRAFLDCYADDLIAGSDSVFEYDYHSRLFDWGQGLTLGGADIHADQIRYIIEKLKSEPVSRRAVAVTWNPAIDESLDDCPCLQLIQCVIRKEGEEEGDARLLDMKVIFRSNDMLSAAGANMYALARLQQHIADAVGVPVGAYTHISLVPHVYYRRDVADIPPFCGEGTLIRPVRIVCAACRGCLRGEGI